jgi:6,7-dimethyl-8-ribityllumazine synthase
MTEEASRPAAASDADPVAEPERIAQPEPVARSEPAAAEPASEPEPEEPPRPEPDLQPVPAEPEAVQHAAGDLEIPEGVEVLEGEARATRRLVAVVVSKFNGEITSRLLASALDELDRVGIPRAQVTIVPVPGAFELPLAAMALAKTRRYLCVVALGCVIRGETPHFDYVASEAASGLQLAGLETGVPVSFGVLTCDSREQAEARVDRGADAAHTALEMADLFSQLRQTAAAQA